MNKLPSNVDCTGCMACIDACHRNALSWCVDEGGYIKIKKDAQKCSNCGLCVKICPLNRKKALSAKHDTYAAWNLNDTQRKISASGGAFSALAAYILSIGGVVYGASIKGFEVKHVRIETENELKLILGSKYQHSIKEGIYRQVKLDLRENRVVLFSGTPCEIAGLISFLGNKKFDNLYTVDIICGGHSTMLPMLSLQNSGKYCAIQSFRDKEKGWKSVGFHYQLKLINKNGSIENLGLDNYVLNTFSSKLLKRSSCLDCKFTGNNHMSDCTIGDFWGDFRFKREHYEGVSVVIIHNKRILEIIDNASLFMEKISLKDVVRCNHNYLWTHYPLIRYFPARAIALKYMSSGCYEKADFLMQPNSWSGFLLRIYLKINTLHRFIKNKFI